MAKDTKKSSQKNKKVKFDDDTDESSDEYESQEQIQFSQRKNNLKRNLDDNDEDQEDIDEDESEEDDDDEGEDDDEDGEDEEEDDDGEDEEDDDEEDEDEEQDDEDTETKNSKSTSGKKTSHVDNVRSAIQSQLNTMTFEEIQKLQNKIGLKKFKEVMNDQSKDDNEDSKEVRSFKRLNKNRPQELSSKKPVSAFRNVFQVKKNQNIDPRFNPAMGEYKPEVFRKRYDFINDMRKREIQELKDQLKKEENPEKKPLIISALTRLKQQVKTFDESEKNEKMKQKLKNQARQEANQGNRPQFVNKTELRIMELAEKYKELKKSGKVEKFLAKKRKKQLSKDSKHLQKNKITRFV